MPSAGAAFGQAVANAGVTGIVTDPSGARCVAGQLQFDAALSRIFGIRESLRLEVRAEAFNVINHTNLIAAAIGTGIPAISTSGISLSRSASNFGQITSAGDPRILQFAMKLYF